MLKFLILVLFLISAQAEVFKYPEVRRDYSAYNDYFGKLLIDPYQWMEDIHSNETLEFIEKENQLTDDFLSKNKERDIIYKTFKEKSALEAYGSPKIRGDHYFFTERDGKQNQLVVYFKDGIEGEKKILVDPNLLSDEGTTAINAFEPSKDGKFLAYSLSQGGSDKEEIFFMHVDNQTQIQNESVKGLKFSNFAWTKDSKGVFYSYYPNAEEIKKWGNENQKIFYHRVGTGQEKDIEVYTIPPEPKLYRSAEKVSEDGKYVILSIFQGASSNSIYYSKIPEEIKGPLDFHPIFKDYDAIYGFIGMSGPKLVFQTNKDAANYRLIAFDPTDNSLEEIIPEDPDHSMCSFLIFQANILHGNKALLCYIKDVKSVLKIYDLASRKFIYTLPIEHGQVSSFTGTTDKPEFFFSFTSFVIGRVYRVFGDDFQLEIYREITIPNFDPSQIETKQVFYSSKDGTPIPMYIVKKKNTEMKKRPLLLEAYGGFGIELLPSFGLESLVFIQNFDGIYALANIRGGGEYGRAWHYAGRLLNKQNCFDDFQAAAEYLIEENYTDSSMLVIKGDSNGGLLMGANVNQRPDLFAAVISGVGLYDMLRYHKYPQGNLGVSEYGSSDERESFDYLLRYSPLHNIHMPKNESVQYPAIFVHTGDKDDRLHPAHTYKYAAELQYKIGKNSKQTNPILLRVNKNAGHGAGKPKDKQIEETADVFAFIQSVLKLQFDKDA